MLLSRFSRVQLCVTPETAARQAPPPRDSPGKNTGVGCHFLLQCIWRFLKKLGIKPPYDPAIPLLDTYPKETKIERDTRISLFIATLFTIARTWKQSRCPWTDEWIKKLWYIYTMEYYSAINRNTFESVLMRWMNLEPIMQSEVSQKDKYHILIHIYRI